jgi:hypothetical protein
VDDKQFKLIAEKLDAIISLLAADRVADKSKKEAIVELAGFGIDNGTIASIVNTTPATVAVRLSESKKKGKEPA